MPLKKLGMRGHETFDPLLNCGFKIYLLRTKNHISIENLNIKLFTGCVTLMRFVF